LLLSKTEKDNQLNPCVVKDSSPCTIGVYGMTL